MLEGQLSLDAVGETQPVDDHAGLVACPPGVGAGGLIARSPGLNSISWPSCMSTFIRPDPKSQMWAAGDRFDALGQSPAGSNLARAARPASKFKG
jgi:hypothetical protein